eukprot:395306_1
MAHNKLNSISKQTKYKVFGYIHDMEKQLDLPSIPLLIIYKCLLFGKDEDYFKNGNKDYKFSNKDTTITKLQNNYWSERVSSNVEINGNWKVIVKWTIKVNKCTEYALGIIVGLTQLNIDTKEKRMLCDLCNSGICNGQKYPSKFEFGDNDIFSVILDLYGKKIKYKLNDKKEILFADLPSKLNNKKFSFFANIFYSNNSITLIDFAIDYKK